MKRYISWSGGKDSTATIILAHLKNIKIDKIVISLPMFDKKRGIYADHPKHIDWIFQKAIPTFEEWGYSVDVVSSDRDYLYWFYKVRTNKCKNKDYVGKYYGWLLGGMCKMNEEKTLPIKKYIRQLGEEYQCICGIGAEETPRLERMHQRGQISLLEQYNYTTEMARDLCAEYGLLSPLYSMGRHRQGCWFCPNASIEEYAKLKQEYPHLWNELVQLNKVQNTCTRGYKYGTTFDDLQMRVDHIIGNRQLSIFD